MEVFEKELGDTKPGADDGPDNELEDDANLGDDPFAAHVDGVRQGRWVR